MRGAEHGGARAVGEVDLVGGLLDEDGALALRGEGAAALPADLRPRGPRRP